MIKRGPDPQGNFQILPHETSRDKRLSFRARGLLALMLSYPVDWEFNRDWLARQSDKDGVTAVRSTLKELEDAGYLVRRRIRINGRFGWEHTIYRHAQKKSAGESTGGLQADGIPAAGDPPSKEDGDGNLHEDDLTRVPHSQAPATANESNANADADDELSWRHQDRARFSDLIDGHLKSEGGRWKRGLFTADAFYNGFRQGRDKKWPGLWLQQIADRDGGLEDWLIDEGLEIVPHDPWARR